MLCWRCMLEADTEHDSLQDCVTALRMALDHTERRLHETRGALNYWREEHGLEREHD